MDRVEVGGTFAPLPLKEGAGGNFRILRGRRAELDLRVVVLSPVPHSVPFLSGRR